MKFFIISTFSILLSADVISIYNINGMMCELNCPKIVFDSIIDEKGINSCKVNFEKNIVTIAYDDEIIKSHQIKEIISTKTYFKINDTRDSFSLWNWLFN